MPVDFNAELRRLKRRLRRLHVALDNHLSISKDMNSDMSQEFDTTEQVPLWIVVTELLRALAETRLLLDLDEDVITQVHPRWPQEIKVLRRLFEQSQRLFTKIDRTEFDNIFFEHAQATTNETLERWQDYPTAEEIFEMVGDIEVWKSLAQLRLDPRWNDSGLLLYLRELEELLESRRADMLPEQKKLLGKYLRRLRLNSLDWLDKTADSDPNHPNYTNNPDYTSISADWVSNVIKRFAHKDPGFADQMATEQLLNDIAERIDLDGYDSFRAWMHSPLPAAKIRSGISFNQIPPPINGSTTGCEELLLVLTRSRRGKQAPPAILEEAIEHVDSQPCSGKTKRVVVFLTNWDSYEIDKEAPGVFDRIDRSIESANVRWSFLVLNPGMRSFSLVDYEPRQP